MASITAKSSNESISGFSGSGSSGRADSSLIDRNERQENLKKAEDLRREIAKRSGQLQEIINTAMDVMKSRGDVVVRRILENLNLMIDQARTRADKILKEPSSSEVAIRTLNAINQGLNNVNRMITNVLQQINIRIIVDSIQNAANKDQQYSITKDLANGNSTVTP